MEVDTTDITIIDKLQIVDLQRPINCFKLCQRKKLKRLLYSIGFERGDIRKITVTRLIPGV